MEDSHVTFIFHGCFSLATMSYEKFDQEFVAPLGSPEI